MVTITGYDAWVASRVMVDLPVEGKIGDVSAGARPLVERLLANAPSSRRAVLDGFAAAQAEPDRLVQAIVDARPTGPEPERPPDGTAGRHPGGRPPARRSTGPGRGRAGCPAAR